MFKVESLGSAWLRIHFIAQLPAPDGVCDKAVPLLG